MTEYFVQGITDDRQIVEIGRTTNKKQAFRLYQMYCEDHPKSKFKVVKRITTEETIAESEDVRQARFDFV